MTDMETMSEGLFPPTASERLDKLAEFVRMERAQRLNIASRRPDQSDYWRGRIADADEALHHIEQLRRELA